MFRVKVDPKVAVEEKTAASKEAFPLVTFDGKYLFLMSNRVDELNKTLIPDGPGNVCWVDARIVDDLKPKELK